MFPVEQASSAAQKKRSRSGNNESDTLAEKSSSKKKKTSNEESDSAKLIKELKDDSINQELTFATQSPEFFPNECANCRIHLPQDILANKTFSLHRCTPLYKFQRNNLTKYGEELYAFMVAQMTDSTTVITEEEADMFNGRVISVKITTINPSEWTGLAGSPLIIEIIYKPRGRTADQVFYVILLPDVNGDGDEDRNDATEDDPLFTRFPMLLIKAPPKLAEIIFEWLQTRFDCRICRYRLQSAQLRFIAKEWAKSAFGQEQLEANNVKSLELSYSLPNIDELKTMTVNIPFEDVKRIYNGCTSSETDRRLMQAIEHHIFHISRIKLSSLVLSRIGTNTVYLAGEGKAKFFLLKDTNTTVKVLEQLIAIAK